jgi:hypothetical protein
MMLGYPARVALFILAAPAISAAQYRAEYFPGSMKNLCPGWTYTVDVRVRNTGGFGWTQTAFLLSYHWYDTAGNVIVQDGTRTPMTVPNVPPNAEHTFRARLDVPVVSPGTYVLKWDMVIDNVAYFSELGAATKDVSVGIDGVRCARLVAAQTVQKIPTITSVYQKQLGPGDVVVVGGLDFGDTQGKLVLKGSAQSYPLGEVKLDTPVWKDTVVGGIVPDSIKGVVDQPAELVITRADNGTTATWPIGFYARPEMRYVDSRDMTTYCWPGSWKDWCNGEGERASEFTNFGFNIWLCLGILNPGGAVAAPIHATHQGHPWDWGVDTYDINLQNGWRFNDMSYHVKYPGTLKTFANDGIGSDISIWAHWEGHPTGVGKATEYCAYVQAIGPLGVPYK